MRAYDWDMRQKANKPSPPFCLRLSEDERARLEREAVGLLLGEYVRQRVFDEGDLKRRVRNKFPVKDHLLLSQVLGQLGRTRMANNLNQLAKAANCGCLNFGPETQLALMEACADIREIKTTLIKALGLSDERFRTAAISPPFLLVKQLKGGRYETAGIESTSLALCCWGLVKLYFC